MKPGDTMILLPTRKRRRFVVVVSTAPALQVEQPVVQVMLCRANARGLRWVPAAALAPKTMP